MDIFISKFLIFVAVVNECQHNIIFCKTLQKLFIPVHLLQLLGIMDVL